MKKIIKLLSFVLVIATMLTAFSSCDSLFGTSEEKEGQIPTLDPKDSNVMFLRSDVAVAQNNPSKFYIPHQADEVKCVDSFTDGAYNYYYYYLGYLENFPLVYSSTAEHTGQPGTSPNYSMTVGSESQESIEDSVSKSVTETTSKNWQNEVTIEAGVNFDWFSLGGSVGTSWGEEHSTSTSTETTHSVAKSWAESTSHTFQLSLKQDDPAGFYRYVHYARKCDVYVLAVYDHAAKKFSYDYVTLANKSIKDSVVLVEYSPTGNFESDNASNLTFDRAILLDIDLNEKLPNRGVSSNAIKIDVNRHLCKQDAGFSLDTDGDSAGKAAHDGFEIGHLTVYGCTQNSNNKNAFTITDPSSFAIEYVFEQDVSNLPHPQDNEFFVYNDDYRSVEGTEIKGSNLGKGAYQVRIVRKNGQSDTPIIVRDFMKNKTKGSVQDVLKNVPSPETVAKVEITIVYELREYLGWNLFNIGSFRWTNWRSDYTFYFNGATPDDFAN